MAGKSASPWCAVQFRTLLLTLLLTLPAAAADDAPASAPHAPPAAILEIRDDLPPLPTIDLTAETDDLWVRIRNGFAMPNLDSPLVAQQQAHYLNRPEYLKRITERGRRYLHHIVEELERRGMPTELALLPIVESAYNPMAYSSAQASGLWQFIPSTGKSYRLQQNWWVDQRRDIVASTNAALNYLQYIYDLHGDWHLALASYNWGEGAVGRAIAKNKAAGQPTDYLSINMPAETRNYVPKLQALKNIIAQPQLFSVDLDPIPNRPYFSAVPKHASIDMALAAKLADMPLDELRALNPAHNRPVIRSTGDVSLVLPADKIDSYLVNLENYDKPLVSWRTYTLKRGEKLDKVAQRYGLTTTRLREINGIKPKMKLAAGHTLLVPARGSQVAEMPLEVNIPYMAAAKTKVKKKSRKSPTARSGKTGGKSVVKPARRKGGR